MVITQCGGGGGVAGSFEGPMFQYVASRMGWDLTNDIYSQRLGRAGLRKVHHCLKDVAVSASTPHMLPG